jgi:AbrB family looped-hinge helix DNA binding protein
MGGAQGFSLSRDLEEANDGIILYFLITIRSCKAMDAVTISSKYQVVIPRSVREKFHLKPGQKIAFIPYNGTLRVVIIPPIEESRGFLKGISADGIREEEDEER